MGRRILNVTGWLLIAISLGLLSFDFWRFTRLGYLNLALANEPLTSKKMGVEVVVVLTGDHTRIPKAFEIMRERESDWLVISGAGRGITLTELVNQQGDSATAIHSVWGRIVLESRSSSTLENGIETVRALKDKKPDTVILVTSDYHMPRAATIFRDLISGVNLIERPVSSGLLNASFFSTRMIRFAWIVGLEYWKFRLYLTRRALNPDFPTGLL